MSQFPQGETITPASFNSMIETMPTITLVTLYSVSKYHEKWRVTDWCLRALEKRGFSKEDVAYFDDNFKNFYHQMMVQQDL